MQRKAEVVKHWGFGYYKKSVVSAASIATENQWITLHPMSEEKNTESDTPPNQESKKKTVWGAVINLMISGLIVALSLVVAIALFGLRAKPKQSDDQQQYKLVDLVEVEPFKGPLQLRTNGTVEPYRQITISAEVGGKVTNKSEFAKAGRFVRKGDVLLEIDKLDYELEEKRASAEVEQARLQIKENDEEMANARELLVSAEEDEKIQQAEYDRRLKLQGAISQAELDQTRRSVIAAKNTRIAQANQIKILTQRNARLSQTLELAKTGLALAKRNVERSVVRADDDGLLVSDMCEKGDFVERGRGLFEFEDTSAAEVAINLRRSQLQMILDSTPTSPKSADPTQIAPPGLVYELPKLDAKIYSKQFDAEWDGQLYRFDGAGLDEATRSARCRVKVKNRLSNSKTNPQPIRRKMYVDVKISVQTNKPLGALPVRAVHPGGEIWLAEEKTIDGQAIGVLKKVFINEINRQETENGEIVLFWLDESAPQAGTKVIITPIQNPPDGMQVRLTPEKKIADAAKAQTKSEPNS